MPMTYEFTHRASGLYDEAETYDDMLKVLDAERARIVALKEANVEVDVQGDDYVIFRTTDKATADRLFGEDNYDTSED